MCFEFESSVNLYGDKTINGKVNEYVQFESSVNLHGDKTYAPQS